MSYILFTDRSQWNGAYNAAGDPNPAVALKMSGGDGPSGYYYDSHASANYAAASSVGKVIIGYHFAGGTDPIGEADFFIRAMSPIAENDILALDWEVSHPDPVGWCTQFVNRVHDTLGVWPLVYMNMSTANAHDWSPVFNNCGYWCAAPSFSFDDTLPVKYPQIAQQGPIVNGIDTDAFYGTIDQLRAYGYHAKAQPTAPPPAPAPAPQPEPTPPPETPVPSPSPSTPAVPDMPSQVPPEPKPVVVVTPPPNWLTRVIQWIVNLFSKRK